MDIFIRNFDDGSCSDYLKYDTTQKMNFSIKDFFSKCDQIRSFH